jgi:hypothetical protein
LRSVSAKPPSATKFMLAVSNISSEVAGSGSLTILSCQKSRVVGFEFPEIELSMALVFFAVRPVIHVYCIYFVVGAGE